MAADAQTLPDGSPMPKPWARLLGASLEPPKIGQDGLLLGETQILTYAGLLGVTVETDKLKGGDNYFYLQAICRAPTATGEPCGLVQKLTRHGATDIEFGNTMDHLVAKHLVLVNIAHRSKPKKGASASQEAKVEILFSKAAIEEESKKVVMLHACSGLPLKALSADSPAWIRYNAGSRPVIPRSSLRYRLDGILTTEVKKAAEQTRNHAEKRQKVGNFELPVLLTVSHDAYKDTAKRSKVCVALQFGAVVGNVLHGQQLELRPRNIILGLKQYPTENKELTDEEGNTTIVEMGVRHTASNTADLVVESMESFRLSSWCKRLEAVYSDTASAALAVAKTEQLSSGGLLRVGKEGSAHKYGPFAGSCSLHVDDLICEDLIKRTPKLKVLLELTSRMVIFFGGSHSDKALDALNSMQRNLNKRVFTPDPRGETRFYTAYLELEQCVEMIEPVLRIDANVFTDVTTRIELRKIQGELREKCEDMIAISELMATIMKLSMRKGSKEHYVLSIELPIFHKEVEIIDAFTKRDIAARTVDEVLGEPTILTEVLEAYAASLWTRKAPDAYFDVGMETPPGAVRQSGDAQNRRIAGDRRWQLACLLDPAISAGKFAAMGCSVLVAKEQLIAVVKTGIMIAVEEKAAEEEAAAAKMVDDEGEDGSAAASAGGGGAGGGGAGGGGAGGGAGGAGSGQAAKRFKAASKYATFEAELATIKAEERSRFESPDLYKARKTAEIAACKDRWKRGGTRSVELPPANPAELDAWAEKQASVLVDLEHSLFIAERLIQFGEDKFGDILAPYSYLDKEKKKVDVPEVTARYTWWPKMQSLFPAHFYAATIALCSPASTLACESTFSVAAYIMNKLRSRMTAQTHELLTLAKINIERSLKESDELMALEMEAKTRGCLNTAALDKLIDGIGD